MDLTRTIHEKMMNERIMFVYRGEITEKNSLPLLTLLENEMRDDSYGLSARKRLFMYVLENLQNIAKHGEHKKREGMSVVAYSKTDNGYTITTGNLVAAGQVENLREKLARVNKLAAEEIKSLYRQILNTAEFSEKGGAGLGLIEMAQKTGNRLDYDFIPVNSDYSYFVLSKTVDSSGMGAHSAEVGERFESTSFIELVKLMSANKIHITWSGHMSADIGGEVLSLTESTLTEEDIETGIRRRVFSIMVELLENISKYSPVKEQGEKFGMPVAMIRMEDFKFNLSTGNLILNQSVDDLRVKLDTINSYNRAQLKDLFFSSLKKQTFDSDSTGNLGLITIARKAGSKLNYKFQAVNELYSYFMLTVSVGEVQNG